MKIMHLTYDMRIGGTEMVIKNIIEGSDASRFEMSIFCIESLLGPWGQKLERSGIPVAVYERKPGFDLSLIKAIREHLKQHQIDVIHCHQYTPWVYGALAVLSLKTKVIFTEHGRFYPDRSSWKRKLVNPWLCRITDSITSISEATKQALVEYENIPTERIKTIYNGIKPLIVDEESVAQLRESLCLSPVTKVIGSVARFDPIKNHPMMLRAFDRLLESCPDTKLLLVGDGEERVRIEQLIKELGLEGKVILPGYQTDAKDYIALMDVFLLSSFSEGTSMTLLEAMSLQKPCVVTNVGGNPEIIVDDKNGLVVESDDVECFASAIAAILSDEQLRNRYSMEAKQLFNSLFRSERMNEKYGERYCG